MWGFRVEPAAVSELVRQCMFMSILFGLIHWTDVQQAAVLSVVSAIMTLVTRANSTSERTLNRAGTNSDEVNKVAENPTQVLTVTQLGGQ